MRSVDGFNNVQKEQGACLRKNDERFEREFEVKEIRADGEREASLRNVSSLDLESGESEGVRCCEREIG